MRIGAACVMTAAGAWSGRMLAGAQMRRTRTLEALRSGVRRLETEMLERRMPLSEALEACENGLFCAGRILRPMSSAAIAPSVKTTP